MRGNEESFVGRQVNISRFPGQPYRMLVLYSEDEIFYRRPQHVEVVE